jgi:hypothetical protein
MVVEDVGYTLELRVDGYLRICPKRKLSSVPADWLEGRLSLLVEVYELLPFPDFGMM